MKKKIKTDKGPLTNVFFFFLPSKFSFFLPLRIRENNCYFCIITIWFSSAYKSAISFVWQPNELGWNGTTDFLRRVFMKKKIAKWRNVWLRINKQHFNSFFCWESFIMLVRNYLSINPLCVVTSTTVNIGSLKSNRNWCALIKKTTIMTSLTSKYAIFMQSWHQSIAITANHRFFRGDCEFPAAMKFICLQLSRRKNLCELMISLFILFNLPVPNAPFLYPLKRSEHLMVFLIFLGGREMVHWEQID